MAKNIEAQTIPELETNIIACKIELENLNKQKNILSKRIYNLKYDKTKISDNKKIRIQTINENIAKAKTKLNKDSYRRTKARESKSFDDQKANIDRSINNLKNEISTLNTRISNIKTYVLKCKFQIKLLKN